MNKIGGPLLICGKKHAGALTGDNTGQRKDKDTDACKQLVFANN